MMNQETNHGITYSLSFLRNADYSKVLFLARNKTAGL